MNRERFISERRNDWQEFETLLLRLQRTRQSKWSGRDVASLSRLYRSICYDLSLVQSREWGSRLEQYLNDLVAQGHNCLYRSAPKSLSGVGAFLASGFPRLVRRRKLAVGLAAALFVIPFVICTYIGMARPDLAALIAGEDTIRNAVEMYSESRDERYSETSYAGERSLMFGFYVSHNTGIAFRAFAKGALLGIGTCQELLLNGILLGVISGAVIGSGEPASSNFTSFVISHGSFELTAIVIAGAAGLVLARGMLIPGERTRMDALRFHGKEALQMALGAGVMLGIAAMIEGYFSPSLLPHSVKYGVGSILWLLVICYLTLAGRERTAA